MEYKKGDVLKSTINHAIIEIVDFSQSGYYEIYVKLLFAPPDIYESYKLSLEENESMDYMGFHGSWMYEFIKINWYNTPLAKVLRGE